MIDRIRKARDEDSGFTLIELLVVVIIIGILAAIAIPVFLNQRESAWESAVESDLRNAGTEMETYYTQHNAYPDSTDMTFDTSDGVTLTINEPASTGGSESFCIEGAHSSLSGTVLYYDSDGGGLSDTC